jgi:uncharacterized damage-inducible protein DinB
MRDGDRLTAEVDNTISGDPWYGSSVLKILEGVDAAMAASRPIADAHSIWELVLHMTAWTRETTRRLKTTTFGTPLEGDFPPIPEVSVRVWADAIADLREAHAELSRALSESTDALLNRQVGGTQVDALGHPVTLHRTVVGLLQHDAYHAGQIGLLKKMTTGS